MWEQDRAIGFMAEGTIAITESWTKCDRFIDTSRRCDRHPHAYPAVICAPDCQG